MELWLHTPHTPCIFTSTVTYTESTLTHVQLLVALVCSCCHCLAQFFSVQRQSTSNDASLLTVRLHIDSYWIPPTVSITSRTLFKLCWSHCIILAYQTHRLPRSLYVTLEGKWSLSLSKDSRAILPGGPQSLSLCTRLVPRPEVWNPL